MTITVRLRREKKKRISELLVSNQNNNCYSSVFSNGATLCTPPHFSSGAEASSVPSSSCLQSKTMAFLNPRMSPEIHSEWESKMSKKKRLDIYFVKNTLKSR
ncbi:sterile alpha motif domain-containing protein 12-like [Platysternon megacephalum]|uniref:Sterile alpha motif domain-containing protein 12-like n=1 Tax=Platysternon megacephalum TaxID=55544 RepID=A0A4D9E2Z5_9SAUR|nr:sterile alpha motif domain-containing protein 12-like [Platysternon megacephalum]